MSSIQRQQALPTSQNIIPTDSLGSSLGILGLPSRLRYTPYGFSAHPTGSGRLAFIGQYLERSTSHYILGNGYRSFAPALMRFLTPDAWSPFNAGGINSYAYCQGDPINRTDPSGRAPERAKSYISDVARVVVNALTSGPVSADQFSPTRKEVAEKASRATLFGNAVIGVNRNLGSHENNNLPPAKATTYIEATHNGKSNSYNFFISASEWGGDFKRSKSADAWVGMTFNLLGGFFSGVVDKALYNTGDILRTGAGAQASGPTPPETRRDIIRET
ncbi:MULTISPECIES: RHS repeat-associated core domain-containing protein [unclassified Pseudomonas]|uniref:RHS repeat-associated core domain-containing protein n=1 Tax=unclassified Pseudomonas TaxID=196821 RepID=UPI002446C507|nr:MULTISPECIES: RHS repeat-associated core domain-containing protein [unclassified Pseudomonas]MDH0300238.1 RHS repeat-associated core domain-containing protein [Pseudomonas sp. GD04091]MDH1986824.1 RHS repeat-associated core domain-containing protein [Pseudomonas sp. GD03689]